MVLFTTFCNKDETFKHWKREMGEIFQSDEMIL